MRKPKLVGIYTITSITNGRVYVGQTKDFVHRKAEHLAKLGRGNHENIHLQRSYNKYGEDDFVWNLDECNVEHLTELEQFYIDSFDPGKLFNINLNAAVPPVAKKGHGLGRKGGVAWNKGLKITEETRKKISDGVKGTKMPQSQKDATSRRMKGNPYIQNPESKRKMSDRKRSFTDEQCKDFYLRKQTGVSYYQIQKETGIHRHVVKHAINYYENHLI